MGEENFSAVESLQLIQSMIDKTRRNISRQSRYFLLWGWSAFAACVGQYLLFSVFHSNLHYLVWLISIPCSLLTVYFSSREQKQSGVRTYIDENMSLLWSGIGISFFVITLLFVRIGWYYCFPFFITFYGLGTFISGRILRFKPLIIGGVVNWMLAIAAVWFSFEYQILFGAGALLVSYIIPGHMIMRVEKLSHS